MSSTGGCKFASARIAIIISIMQNCIHARERVKQQLKCNRSYWSTKHPFIWKRQCHYVWKISTVNEVFLQGKTAPWFSNKGIPVCVWIINQEPSADESIIVYKGRLSWIQYMSKNTKWCIKECVLANAKNVYVYNTGKSIHTLLWTIPMMLLAK